MAKIVAPKATMPKNILKPVKPKLDTGMSAYAKASKLV